MEIGVSPARDEAKQMRKFIYLFQVLSFPYLDNYLSAIVENLTNTKALFHCAQSTGPQEIKAVCTVW